MIVHRYHPHRVNRRLPYWGKTLRLIVDCALVGAMFGAILMVWFMGGL